MSQSSTPHPQTIHDRIEELLPWYVNATLTAEETGEVDAHLGQCQACRDSLAVEEALARQVKMLPLGAHLEETPAAPRFPARAQPFWHRRVGIGWALASPLLAASLAAIAVLGLRPGAPSLGQAGPYVALSAASSPGQGNLLVKLQPDASENQVRDLLQKVGARVVDGPTVADAWVLRVQPDQRDTALHRLQQASIVTLAQPLVPDAQQ